MDSRTVQSRGGRRRIAVAVNAKSGAAISMSGREFGDRIAEALSGQGEVAEILTDTGDRFFDRLSELARRPDVDILAVAGGDGTISAAAGIARESGKRLLPIPCGTFNLFCRALGFPPDPHKSIALFDSLVADDVDIGSVNGQVFIHHVSGGLHPRFVRIRDSVPVHSRRQKIFATFRAALRAMRSIPRTPMVVVADGRRRRRRLAGFAITVNPIAETPASPPVAVDPKEGVLGIYLTDVHRRRDAFWVVVRAIAGMWKSSALVETDEADAVRIVARGRTLSISVDGERRRLSLPLDIRLERLGLKVLRPRPEGQPETVGASTAPSSASSSG